MKIGIIGEGETEYDTIPALVSKFGHTIVGVRSLGGIGAAFPWDPLFKIKVYPYVRGFALKPLANRPDKVIIVLDREKRIECCGFLASTARSFLQQKLAEDNLKMNFSVVLTNRQLECWLLADTKALDKSPFFKRPMSELLGDSTDEKNVLEIIKQNLRPHKCWNKKRYGKALAQHLDITNPSVLSRSRSLQKFVKEISTL